MDILRIIKLKKFYGELNNLTPEEKFFFGLHDKLHNDNGVLRNKNGDWLFEYDIKNKTIWYHYDRVWVVFKNNFDINHQDFILLVNKILEKYLNLRVFTPSASCWGTTYRLEKYTILKYSTTKYRQGSK